MIEKYELGQFVYLCTDIEKLERVITGIFKRQNGVTYELSHGTQTSVHYDFEITTEKKTENSIGFGK